MHDPIQTTTAANAATPSQSPASLSELQDIVKKLADIEPVDDTLWMNTKTFESLCEQLGIKFSVPPKAKEEYFTLTALSGVQIHLDETLAARVVESGSYEMNPRLPAFAPARFALAKRIVRHRYTI